MRTLAFLFGVLVFAGLVAMAVAGFPGAKVFLATGLGIVAMIALGVQLGGRHSTTPRAPRPVGGPGDDEAGPGAPGSGPAGGTPAAGTAGPDPQAATPEPGVAGAEPEAPGAAPGAGAPGAEPEPPGAGPEPGAGAAGADPGSGAAGR